ncbi:MAG: LPP20 family lipoprotein [Elusimicrobiota bacterium]
MNKKIGRLIIVPFLALCAACSFLHVRQKSRIGVKPDWIEHWTLQYPASEYLAGVGVGYGRASAEDFARGEIAKIFSAKVSVTESAAQTETDSSSQGAGGGSSSLLTSASQNVKTISNQVLKGTRIAEEWKDPKTNEDYALAVLNRAKAQASLEEQVQNLDADIAHTQTRFDSSQASLSKAKDAMTIVADFGKRRALAAELQVVGQSGLAQPPSQSESDAKNAAQSALAALNVAVDLTGDPSDAVATGVIQGLNHLGIPARMGNSDPKTDIAISGEIFVSRVDLGQSQWKRARSAADIRITDAAAAKTIVALHPSARADATDYETAKSRSMGALAAQASDQVQKAVSGYLESQ